VDLRGGGEDRGRAAGRAALRLATVEGVHRSSLAAGSSRQTQVIDRLAATNRNFKYVVHVTLVARGGNGLDVGGLCFWNADMDGSVAVKWENKHMTCIVTVYGIAN
jgi:hypothetical protein